MILPFRNLFTFYREAYGAVTDFRFYRTVFYQPWRPTLIYLLYLSAHLALLLPVIFALRHGSEFARFSRWAQDQFPEMEVKRGRLAISGKQPSIKRYDGEQDLTFVFDTTGKYKSPEGFDQPAILLTREELFFRSEGLTQAYKWQDLEPIFGGKLNRDRLREMERSVRIGYFPITYSILLIYNLVAKSFTAVFLSSFALVAAARFGLRMPFRSSFSLGLYSLTPAVVIGLAVSATGIYISYFFVIYLAIGAIYAFMATTKSIETE